MINSFRGPYRFLSNFYIEPDGSHVEGEYQRAKCKHISDQARFTGLTPGEAKRLGRQVTVRDDWEQVKLGVMKGYVTKKFADHAELRKALLDTLGHELKEGNSWGDDFWGVYTSRGQNHLGKILMDVRREVSSE